MVKINHWSQLSNNTLYIYSIFLSCKKYMLKSGKVLFEGCFLKGNSCCKLGSCINTWRLDTTPAIWFFTMEKKYFLKLLSVLTWVLTNFNAETEGYIPNCLRPHHFFKGFITSKLTRIFVNFRVIHVLLSLILFYRIMLDQISHTWFEWNLVNGCTSWNSHPNCLYVCS